MPVEAGIGILDDGHPGELDAEVEAVDALQDQRVRVEDADLQHDRDVRVHAELERAIGTGEQPLEARGGVEALQPERQEGGRVLLTLEGGREHRGHERVEQVRVRRQGGRIDHRPRQLRGLPHLLQHGSGGGGEHGSPFGYLPVPVSDEGPQAELRPEREPRPRRWKSALWADARAGSWHV